MRMYAVLSLNGNVSIKINHMPHCFIKRFYLAPVWKKKTQFLPVYKDGLCNEIKERYESYDKQLIIGCFN